MYKLYAKENNITSLGIGVHTRLNKELRLSSVYRQYSNPHFCSYGWETFLWKNDSIAKEYDSLNDSDDVINLHLQVKIDYENGIDITSLGEKDD
jgi:hypothetical protein